MHIEDKQSRVSKKQSKTEQMQASQDNHDHSRCQHDLMQRAKSVCAQKKIKLTPLRQEILSEIAASHVALGAYDLRDRLVQKGRDVSPISIYRIIDVLLDAGVIHRLESKNAYFACFKPHKTNDPKEGALNGAEGESSPVFLVCNMCDRIAEIDVEEVWTELGQKISPLGFRPVQSVLEIKGLCKICCSKSSAKGETE